MLASIQTLLARTPNVHCSSFILAIGNHHEK